MVLGVGEGDDEGDEDYGQGEGEDEEGPDDVPEESDGSSEVDFGQGVFVEGGVVNDVEIEAEEPAPDDELRYEAAAAEKAMCEEFEADAGEDKCERSYVLSVEEQLEIVEENGPVEAGEGVAFYELGLDFFRFYVALEWDYEFLSAGMTLCVFSGVPAVEGDERVAFWTIELNRHKNLFSVAGQAKIKKL